MIEWSDKTDTRRTMRGWEATVRQAIRENWAGGNGKGGQLPEAKTPKADENGKPFLSPEEARAEFESFRGSDAAQKLAKKLPKNQGASSQ